MGGIAKSAASYGADAIVAGLARTGLRDLSEGAGADALLGLDTVVGADATGMEDLSGSALAQSELGAEAPLAATESGAAGLNPAEAEILAQLGVDPAAEEVSPMLHGTNVPGQVTSRPSGFRTATTQDAWEEAAVGPSGARICPTQGPNCVGEVTVPPNSGSPRDWHMSHNPSWSNREFPPDVTRKEVLDNYNQGVRLECPACNRGGGNDDTRFG